MNASFISSSIQWQNAPWIQIYKCHSHNLIEKSLSIFSRNTAHWVVVLCTHAMIQASSSSSSIVDYVINAPLHTTLEQKFFSCQLKPRLVFSSTCICRQI